MLIYLVKEICQLKINEFIGDEFLSSKIGQINYMIDKYGIGECVEKGLIDEIKDTKASYIYEQAKMVLLALRAAISELNEIN